MVVEGVFMRYKIDQASTTNISGSARASHKMGTLLFTPLSKPFKGWE